MIGIPDCDCGNRCMAGMEKCASCLALERKLSKQALKVKVVSPVKKVSQKQAVRNIEYLKVRKEYLELYPVCEVPECDLKASDIHHQKGRDGALLMDVKYFMSVCRKHHIEIENNPNWSKEEGYSFKRITDKSINVD